MVQTIPAAVTKRDSRNIRCPSREMETSQNMWPLDVLFNYPAVTAGRELKLTLVAATLGVSRVAPRKQGLQCKG
jgi:hypothetical protein